MKCVVLLLAAVVARERDPMLLKVLESLDGAVRGRWSLVETSDCLPASPCECAVHDDSTSYDCLNRRLVLLSPVQDATTAVDATGLSPLGGQQILRSQYSQLRDQYATDHERIANVSSGIGDRSNGALALMKVASRRIQNEETLSAESINNGYMNLVKVVGMLSDNMSRMIAGTYANSTYSLGNYFTAMQSQEEWFSYQYALQLIETESAIIKENADSINAASGEVFSVLNSLEAQLSSSESYLTDLVDSFRVAGDSLVDRIADFDTSFADQTFSSASALERSLRGLANEYVLNSQTAVGQFSTVAASKISLWSQASEAEKVDQLKSYTVSAAADRAALHTSIDEIRKQQRAFTVSDQFGAVGDYIDSSVANVTNKTQTSTDFSRRNLTKVEQNRFAVTNLLQNLLADERRDFAASSSAQVSAAVSASTSVRETVDSFSARQGALESNAAKLGYAAIDGVGSNTQSGLNELMSDFDAMNLLLANDGNTVSQQTNAVTSGLGSVSQTGNEVIRAADQTLGSSIITVASATLNTLAAVAGTQSAVSAVPVLNSGAGQTAAAVATTAASEAAGPSLQAQAASGNTVENVLTGIDAIAKSADDTITAVGSLVQQGGTAASAGAALASATGVAISDTLAATASGIAQTEDTLSAQLGRQLDSVSSTLQSSAVSGDRLAAGALQNASGSISEYQTQLDAASAAGGQAAAAGAMADAATGMAVVDSQTNSQANSAAGAITGGVLDSQAALDQTVANVFANSNLAASSASSIGAAKDQWDVQVDSFNVAQLDQIRSAAAAMDSLMKIMNGHLSQASPELYLQINGLPSNLQRFFLQLKAASNQVQDIQESIGSPAFSSESTLATLNSAASQQFNDVGVYMNTSASGVTASILAASQSLVQQFSDEATMMKSKLSSMTRDAADAAVAESAETGSTSALSALEETRKAVMNLGAQASESLADAAEGSITGHVTDLLSAIAASKAQGISDAAQVSQVLDSLQSVANSQVHEASVAQTNDIGSDIYKAITIAKLNEGISKAKLDKQTVALNQLNADSANVLSELTDTENNQIAVQEQSAAYMYNRVLDAKANVTSAIGALMSRFANMQTNSSTQVGQTSDAISIAAANLQTQLAAMYATFNQHTNGDKQLFASSRSTGDTHMLEVKNSMGKVEQSLLRDSQEVNEHWGSVSQSLDELKTNSELDANISALQAQVNDWFNNEQSSLPYTPAGVDFVTQIQTPINKKVNSIADMAIQLLQNSGKTVPSRLQFLAR